MANSAGTKHKLKPASIEDQMRQNMTQQAVTSAASLIGSLDTYSPSNAFSGLLSRDDVAKIEEQSESYRQNLHALCHIVVNSGQENLIHDVGPELFKWYQDTTDEMKKKQAEYEDALDKAHESALYERKRIKYYLKFQLQDNLDEDDREFFERKLDKHKDNLQRLYTKFPELEAKVGTFGPSRTSNRTSTGKSASKEADWTRGEKY